MNPESVKMCDPGLFEPWKTQRLLMLLSAGFGDFWKNTCYNVTIIYIYIYVYIYICICIYHLGDL